MSAHSIAKTKRKRENERGGSAKRRAHAQPPANSAAEAAVSPVAEAAANSAANPAAKAAAATKANNKPAAKAAAAAKANDERIANAKDNYHHTGIAAAVARDVAERAIRGALLSEQAHFAARECLRQVRAKNAVWCSPYADEGKGDGSYYNPFITDKVPPLEKSRAKDVDLANAAEYRCLAALVSDGTAVLFTPPTLYLHYHETTGSDVTGDGTPANPLKSYQIVHEIADSYEGACYWYDLKNPKCFGFKPSYADAKAYRRYCKDRWGGKH